MADDPSRGQPGFDPLPGWPGPASGTGDDGPAPAAPPPGWTGSRPRAEPLPAPEVEPPPAPGGPPPGGRRFAALRSRRGIAVAAGVAALVLLGIVGVIVASSGGGGNGSPEAGGSGRDGKVRAPAATTGKDIPLLDGRIVVVAPEGWEPLEAFTDSASFKVNLRDATGRELLATLVMTALPGRGSFDATLTVDGGTRFEVTTAQGPLPATAVPDGGQVLVGAVRPNGRFLISLSVYALDGQGLDAALLQKLFTEQIAPQLRFP